MKFLLLLIVIAVLALFAMAWNAQRLEVAQVRADCESTGIEGDLCACHARKFRERTTVVSYLGFGDFRPMQISRSEKNQAVVKAGALCVAEQLLK